MLNSYVLIFVQLIFVDNKLNLLYIDEIYLNSNMQIIHYSIVLVFVVLLLLLLLLVVVFFVFQFLFLMKIIIMTIL